MATFFAFATSTLLIAALPNEHTSRQQDVDQEKTQLKMSKAVACSKVTGYEQYEPIEDATLTADDKLMVYYKPFNFQVERKGALYRAHLTQDARIRKRGEKAVLQRKDNMMTYKPENKSESMNLYVANTISVKGLSPGEYDLEIILHDRIGEARTATQVLPFRIKAAPKEDEKPVKKDDQKKPAGPAN
jgi:hypothetical protein